jgi:hypothetical protein
LLGYDLIRPRNPSVWTTLCCRLSVRLASSTPAAAAPAAKANALLDAVPGNSITSKAGTVVLTTAVSQELFVLNEEVVILGSVVVFLGYVSSLIRGPYAEWADGQIKVRRYERCWLGQGESDGG